MDEYLESLKDAALWIKFLVLAVTAPIWIPAVKVFWAEVQQALADDGGLFGTAAPRAAAKRPPELDPWRSVPLGSAEARGQRPGSGGAGRGARGPARRAPLRRRL